MFTASSFTSLLSCSQQFGLLLFSLFSIRSFDVTADPPVASLQFLLRVRLKMEFVVNCDVVLYLLVCRLVLSTQAVIISQSATEGRDVSLVCVNGGKVVWSKGTDGGRSAILSAENGEITQKYRPDPENRYRVLPDLSLIINSIALSDSGIYYCNAAPAVNLTVNPALSVIFSHSETEGRDVRLSCVNEGKVTWEKGTDRRRLAILSAENREITQKHRPDPENRYSVVSDSSLMIKSVALSDSGIYYCNSAPAVNLTVNPAPLKAVSSVRPTTERRTDALLTTASSLLHTEPTTTATGGVSVVKTVLMFGGVGLAALMFLLATVAAGRVILHQNRQTGWTAGKEAVQLSPSDGEEGPSSQ